MSDETRQQLQVSAEGFAQRTRRVTKQITKKHKRCTVPFTIAFGIAAATFETHGKAGCSSPHSVTRQNSLAQKLTETRAQIREPAGCSRSTLL